MSRITKLETAKARAEELLAYARTARMVAHAPYSEFLVGAAVIGGSGRVYTGCNIENASYGLTVCAERVAIWKAISEGEETIDVIAVVADTKEIVRPCGACLGVMSEFSETDDPVGIVCSTMDGRYDVMSLNDYLPHQFVL
jgi:cytidine deaminase